MWSFLVITLSIPLIAAGFPEQGVWHLLTDPGHEYVIVKKSMFKDTRIIIKVMCTPNENVEPFDIDISLVLWKTMCFNQDIRQDSLERYLEDPGSMVIQSADGTTFNNLFERSNTTKTCDHNIVLDQLLLNPKNPNAHAESDREVSSEPSEGPGVSAQIIGSSGAAQTNHPVAVIPYDGVYILAIHTQLASGGRAHNYSTSIDIQMKSDYGYLSAADWPLLVFYAAMCVIYLIYGFAWLVVSFLRWRELLRVQYWIGAVILLGMLEKAVFTAEYSSINQRGYSIPGLIVFAELVSCAKRTLAHMLVIIVSLGFGIVKPRLGVILHRIVGVGLLYFVLGSIEGCSRVQQTRSDPQKQVLLATLALSILESAICFWIFTALVQTTRTLRLRRNLVKLSLYRHFTNTLAFAVVASVIIMLWSLQHYRRVECVTDWKELWVDDACWHVLFATILLVIMVLWRPSNNNQRFAFSPLLDDGSDADDEEEGEKLMADISDTMKYRNTRNSTSSPRESRSVEDDLKWVEENIPSSLVDSALPILDSEEENASAEFEINKMQ